MVEYEKLFSQAVQKKLKSIIKGRIFVCVTLRDELLVKIYQDDKVSFQTFIPHITTILWDGVGSDFIVRKVVAEYKQYMYKKIEQQYFY